MMRIHIGEDDVRRVYCGSPLDDHNVQLVPGSYPVEITGIDYNPVTEHNAAYYLYAKIPAVRVHDASRGQEKAGDPETYFMVIPHYCLSRLMDAGTIT